MINLARHRRPSARPMVENLESRKLLTRGLADPTFNGGSALVATLDPSATPGVKLVQTIPLAGGKTLYVGQFFRVSPDSVDGRYALTRLNDDGTLDASFGSGGRVFTPEAEVSRNFVVNAGAVQADGKILLVGSQAGPVVMPLSPTGDPMIILPRQAAVLRLNVDGSIDTSYGISGVRAFNFRTPDDVTLVPPGDSNLTQAELDPQGRLVVAGTLANAYPIPDFPTIVRAGAAFARLTTSGELDPSFGDQGTTILPYIAVDTSAFLITSYSPQALFVAADGSVAAAGNTQITIVPPARPSTGITVFRLDASGNPVASFGDNGRAISGLLPPDASPISDYSAAVTDVALDAQGRTILVGAFYVTFSESNGTGVQRLTPSGAIDTTFGDADTPGVVRRLDSAGPSFASVVVQPDDSLLLAGVRAVPNPVASTPHILDLTKLDASGKLDATFAPGGTTQTPFVGGLSPLNSFFTPQSPIFDAQGRVLVSGTTSTIGGLFAVARFLTDDAPPPPPVESPTVVAFAAVARRGIARRIRLRFSEAMDAASATSPSSYRLVSAGKDRRFGTRDDRTIRIRVRFYDAGSFTVVLSPRRRTPTHQPLALIARGTIRDASGNPLAGSGGVPGTDYIATFGARARPKRGPIPL